MSDLLSFTPASAGQRLSGVPDVPGVWRGAQWQHGAQARALSTGHQALDAQLPGGGWPLGAMSEILLSEHGLGPWNLLAPALAARLAGGGLRAVLVAPPLEPWLPMLQAMGVGAGQVCRIAPEGPSRSAASLWAAEQALRCRQVGAVLAWLPGARAAQLRRLQLAAAQQGQLLWVLRPQACRREASPAALRLWLQACHDRADAARRALLRVHIVKRRGPPLERPVELPLLPRLLLANLQAQAHVQAERRRAQSQAAAPILSKEPGHALAGLAAARD